MVANTGMLEYPSLVAIVQPYAGSYASDPTFMQIVAAGAKAESGWNTNAQQMSGQAGGKGLWQFDFGTTGLNGGMGSTLLSRGVISSFEGLLGIQGAQLQAQYIVPEYASNYAAGLAKGLSGQNLATYVIGATERPCGWSQGAVTWGPCPQGGNSYLNYVNAWSAVTSMPGANVIPTLGNQVPGAGATTTSPAGSSIVTGPTVTGGTTDVPVTGQTGEVNVGSQLQASGVAGQIQVGIQDAFSNLFKGTIGGWGAGLILLFGSLFAIFIGAIIWNGDKVKKYAPDVAVAAATA